MESELRSARVGGRRPTPMRAILVVGGCVGVLLAATGLMRGCRSIRTVTGGIAVWNHEYAAVIVNSKTLTFSGSMLRLLLTRLKHTAGVPSEPSQVSLQTVITQIANGRADSIQRQSRPSVSGARVRPLRGSWTFWRAPSPSNERSSRTSPSSSGPCAPAAPRSRIPMAWRLRN